MKTRFISRHLPSSKGYSLIELSVVIGVIGLVSGGLMTLGTRHVVRSNQTQIDARLTQIEDALALHYRQHGTLPCPASLITAEDTVNFGRGNGCAGAPPAILEVMDAAGVANNDEVLIGAVPTRTLGLPDNTMYDPWGSKIRYAVIKRMTTSAIENFTTALTNGVIQINDISGARITPNGSVVPYALWSHGEDRRGGYNRTGTISLACGGTADSENCDTDHLLIDADKQDSDILANYYQDTVRWKINQHFVARIARQIKLP